jgi:hypothetical protein
MATRPHQGPRNSMINGVTWTLIGTEITQMGRRQVVAGLAVSRHNAALSCGAVFESVSVQKSAAAISF